jgi:uncharacterized membrane protein YfhO
VSYHQGSTISADSLLGVKYLLSQTPIAKPYELLWQQDGISVYKNPYTLPLGFMVSKDVRETSLMSMNESNLFELQNNLWRALVGKAENKLFVPVPIDRVVATNLHEEMVESGTRYTKERENEEAYLEFHLVGHSDAPLYACFPADSDKELVEISVNGLALGRYFTWYLTDRIIELGCFAEGEEIVLKMKLLEDSVSYAVPLFYSQDMEVFLEYYDELSASPYQINSFTDSRLAGEITNAGDKQYALFTIPYDEGWKIFVDGESVTTTQVFDTLLAVEVPVGTHSISLKFTPRGIYPGIAITVFSCLILFAWFVIRHLKRFYPQNYSESAYEIPYAELFKEGYRGIVFDVDNTLVEHGAPANEAAVKLFSELHQLGFQTLILSNNS